MSEDHLRLVVDNSGDQELRALFKQTGQADSGPLPTYHILMERPGVKCAPGKSRVEVFESITFAGAS